MIVPGEADDPSRLIRKEGDLLPRRKIPDRYAPIRLAQGHFSLAAQVPGPDLAPHAELVMSEAGRDTPVFEIEPLPIVHAVALAFGGMRLEQFLDLVGTPRLGMEPGKADPG